VPDLDSLSALAAYAFLAGLVFAECGILLGFFLPGDTLLLGAGILSGGDDPLLSLPALLAVVLAAAVAGDALGYWTGAKGGLQAAKRDRLARHLARAERFYDRFGVLAVVVARWIPWVRVFVPFLAGAARMPYRTFLLANVVGAVCWGGTLLTAGHLVAQLG
jgi:membrane-associated protein